MPALFVLNDTVQFTDLDPTARAAFQTKFGMPSRDRLGTGFRLYKFNNFSTLHAPGNNALSPWWSPYDAYKHDPGWDMRLRMAKANGVSIREWGRLTSAIKENWNSMQYLLVVALKVEAFGFFGGFSSMVRIDPGAAGLMKPGEQKGAAKSLPGGATQFYIPNLTADHVTRVNVLDLTSM